MSTSKKVQCQLCPTECILEDYQIGNCRVRINKEGELYSLVYGKPCSVNIDPIEKKPFSHILPATTAFSIATVGCTMACKFCQNWEISQAKPESERFFELPPQRVVSEAIRTGCKTIAYTYTEPTVFYEYMYDTAVIAKEKGLLNTFHSCGYINQKPLKELAQYLTGANVDLKAFNEDFYKRICDGKLAPVLASLVTLKKMGVWLELTNLVIPTLNDNYDEVRKMCKWIVGNLGVDTPIHFSRFFPYYKLKNLPATPLETLIRVREIAMGEGSRYVYIGNIGHEGNNTYCYKCKKLLIERLGYFIKQNHVVDGKCEFCKAEIAGIWK